jgi:hypothetical protein
MELGGELIWVCFTSKISREGNSLTEWGRVSKKVHLPIVGSLGRTSLIPLKKMAFLTTTMPDMASLAAAIYLLLLLASSCFSPSFL